MATGTHKIAIRGPESGKEVSLPPVEATDDDRAKIETGKRVTEYRDVLHPQGKVIVRRPDGTEFNPGKVDELTKKIDEAL